LSFSKFTEILWHFLVQGSTRKYTKRLQVSLVGFKNKFHILHEDKNRI